MLRKLLGNRVGVSGIYEPDDNVSLVKNTNDTSRYVYNTQSNFNIPGVITLSDLHISSDETRLYLTDATTDRIHQFSLSGFGITCDFNLKSFYIGFQDTSPQGVTIGAAGTAMYIVGDTNNTIYQYTLSTAYDVSTASYSGISSNISVREIVPTDLTFSDDGTKVYISGRSAAGAGVTAGGEYVHQFNLGTAWNVGTAGYSTSFYVTPQTSTNTQGLYIGAGGTVMYVSNVSVIYQYTLATPWEVNTASYASKGFSFTSSSSGFYFNSDGTKFFGVSSSSDVIEQYSVNTPWDISTASYDTKYFYIGGQEGNSSGLYFSPDGIKVYIVGDTNSVYQYSLSIPWDISTVDLTPSAFVGNLDTSPQSLYIKPDGTAAYILGDSSDRIWTLPLTTPWDLKTAPILNSFPVGSQDILPQGVTIGAAGTAMYIVGDTNNTIYQYTLGTAYDVSTASYLGISSSIAARETDPTDLTFSDDGTKVYIIGQTAAGAGVTANLEYVHQFNLSTAWNVGTAGYSTSFNITPQTATLPSGLYIGAGGTAMYTINATNLNVAIHQYTLATPWEVNTASYANKSFSVVTQEIAPSSLYFKPDGTKFYIVGTANDTIYQYTLSTAWDISTVVQPYSGKNFSVSSQDILPQGVTIGAAGTAMYIVGDTNNTIYQYTLGTAYDVSTSVYSGISSSIAARETEPRDLIFSDDGTKVYIIGQTAAGAGVTANLEYVHQFNLSTAWNVSTAGYSTSFNITPQTPFPNGFYIGAGGTAMYAIENNFSRIYQYTLATPWEVNTASYATKYFYIGGQEGTSSGLYFKPDGTKVYVVGSTNDTIHQYTLSTAWDISTASYDSKSLYVGVQETTSTGLYFSLDGTKVYIVGETNDTVYQYNLEVPWELGDYTRSLYIGGQDIDPRGLYFNPTGTKAYTVGQSSDKVHEYPLTIPWDITSSISNFSIFGQDQVPTALYFKPDGTKFYIVGTQNDTIYQYSLLRPWDVTSAYYEGKSFNIGGEELTPRGLYFNTNGTKVYIVGSTSDRVFVYSLRTAWDISTAISPYNIKRFFLDSLWGAAQGVTIGAGGTALYVVTTTSTTIFQYTLGTTYDVSTAVYSGISSNISTRETLPYDLTFSDDGTKVYIIGRGAAGAGVTAGGEYVHQFNLGTAWNVGTVGYSTSFYVTPQTGANVEGLTIGVGGTAMYVNTSNRIFQYTLATPWEVNTASYANKSFSTNSQESSVGALYFKSDGTKVYVVGSTNDAMYQYSLSTAWDISTASYDNKSLYIGVDAINAITGLYFSPDGTRVISNGSGTVFSYDLQIPWELSFNIKSLYVGIQDGVSNGVALSNNLDKLYIVGSGTRALRQYDFFNPIKVGVSGIYEPDDNVSLVKNTNDTSRYVYNTQSNFNIPGVIAITDLYISPDETRLYLSDSTTDRIHQFSLSGFGVTCDFNLKSAYVGSQDILPQGVTIGAAGTAMYIVGDTNNTIYQYTLSTAYDVSTASYSGISSSITARETAPVDLTFSDDGTKVYVVGQTAAGAGVTAGLEYVHQFNLGTAWNVGTAGYSTSFYVTPQTGTTTNGLYIGAGGTAMYITASSAIFQYTLATPWAVNTASYTNKSFSISTQETSAQAIYFKSDGTKVYVVGSTNDTIHQYSLNIPWDISTASYDTKYFYIGGQEGTSSGLYFSPDGTKVFIVGETADAVYQYPLLIPWDISTVVFTPSAFVGNLESTPQSLYIKPDGTAAYVLGDTSDRIWTLPLTTPWDIKTAPRLNSFPVLTQDTLAQGVTIGAAGTAMYIVGSTNDTIYQYTLSTAYDVSTASYLGISSNISARETEPRDLTFSDDGTKVYVVGFTAAGAGVTAGAEYVHQFNLDTAWNVGTAGYSTSFYVTTQTGITPTGLTIGAGGTAMYVLSETNDTIYQYTLATPWAVNTASYTNKSFSVVTQETTPSSLYFKSDGTKVYVLGATNDTIYQYSLSTAWDISTASYDLKGLYVGVQDTDHRGLYFNPDGTKVYTVAATNDRVFEYPLTTAWDITSSVNSFDVSTQEATPTAFYFKPDGTKFYIVGTVTDTIYQYSLSRPWDVTSASYDSKSFDIGGEELTPRGLYFNTDGTKVYIVGDTTDSVYQYSLSIPWDISTAISPYNIKRSSVLTQDTLPQGVTIGAAGTAMYIVGSTNDTIYQYTLSTAYDVSTASYSGISSSIASRETEPRDLIFSDDGTKVYVVGQTAAGAGVTAGAEYVHQFNLGTAWNVSTVGYSTSFYVTTQTSTVTTGLTIGAGGTAMYVLSETNDTIYQYTLATPWAVNTASYTNKSFNVSSQENLPSALYFKPDGTKVYVLGTTNDTIYQYNLSAAWDISTASYDSKGLYVGAQEGDARGLYFNPDGTRVFILGIENDIVFSYDLEVPWELSFNIKSLYVGAEEATPNGITLSNNLDKLYVVGTGTRALHQYDLLN